MILLDVNRCRFRKVHHHSDKLDYEQGVRPPLFVMFVNDQTLMHYSYERYLENFFRKSFGFEGTPIKFVLRERKKEEN